MDFLTEYLSLIVTAIGTIVSGVIAVTSLIKALKSEKRVTTDSAETKVAVNQEISDIKTVVSKEIAAMKTDVQVTRAGIVQSFKDAVVTKDLKVSINTQVKKIFDEKFGEVIATIKKHEETRTKIAYWNLKILANTAAFDKLTTEQQSELSEDLALIADDEKIVDTSVV